MERYGSSELRFSLMALTKDRIELYQEQLEELDGLLLSLPEDAEEERKRLHGDRSFLEHKLQLEKEKRARWHVSVDFILGVRSGYVRLTASMLDIREKTCFGNTILCHLSTTCFVFLQNVKS